MKIKKLVSLWSIPVMNVLIFLSWTYLKLEGYINWSWFWITFPLWILPALGNIALIIIVVMFIKPLTKTIRNNDN